MSHRLDGHADGCRVQSGAPAQAAGERRVTQWPASEVLGRWRIVEIEGWDTEYVDMLGSGHIQLDHDGGHLEFGAVQISLDCWYSKTGAHFTFHGSDEGTEVSSDGDVDLADDSTLAGEIRFHNGDDMPFIAKQW
jgi:hypothetical protein